MKQTTNYGFNKPELQDSPPDITVLNPNFDKIDTQLKSLTDKDTELNTAINQVKNDYLPKTGGNITNGLTVKNKTVAVSVNGSVADANGNITIDVGGDVQSVNGVQPDEHGNVELDLGGDVQSVDDIQPDENGNVALDASKRSEILEATRKVTDVEVDADVATHEKLQTAVARVEANLDSKLPLSGGIMTGAVKFDRLSGHICMVDSNGRMLIRGGTGTGTDGASLYLTGMGYDNNWGHGCFILKSHDGTQTNELVGRADGTLTWGEKNIVRTINGKTADASGNVPFSIGGWTEQLNGVDLNTVKKAGIYYVTNGSASLNVPSGSNGVLIVYANVESDTSPVGTCRQVFYRVGTIGSNDYNIFTRQLHADGTAGEWIRDVYLIDSYKSGASWYRKYSDGWIEQGGNIEAPNSGWTAIPLHIPFSRKDYNLMTCNSGGTTDAFATKVDTSGKNTTTTAYACVYHNSGTGIRWEAKGY